MNEPLITVVGFIAENPRYVVTGNGQPLLTARVGCTPRRFERDTGQWRDGDTMYFTVQCWRMLAENLNSSELKRGHPVVVTGRLRIRDFNDKQGQRRFSAEIDAATVGHDLSRGVARFERPQRMGVVLAADRQVAQSEADKWAHASPSETVGAAEAGEAGEAGERTSDGEHGADDRKGEVIELKDADDGTDGAGLRSVA